MQFRATLHATMRKGPAELIFGRRSCGEVERPSRHLDKTDIAKGNLEGEGRG